MIYTFLRFPGGKPKAVTLSYDDGRRDDIRFADTITRHGLKCTFNLSSSWLNTKGSLTSEEVNDHILAAGHEIAVHGRLHRSPIRIRPIEGIRDVLDCRLDLEKQFGRLVRGMAYADVCATNENIKQYLRDLDIAYARSAGGDNNDFALPTDWLAWMPTAHHTNPLVMKYAEEFVALDINKKYCASRMPKLFYLWGHSFEFSRDNNWELLDSLCEMLSGRSDIWYATNMEIYDYVNAYDSLIHSAQGTMIYNPTLITVWLDIDGVLYKIKPGETITIA